jgi:hypothetical protein
MTAVAKEDKPDRTAVSKRTGGPQGASREQKFHRKCNIGNPLVDTVDDLTRRLCNIESSASSAPERPVRDGYRHAGAAHCMSQMRTAGTGRMCRRRQPAPTIINDPQGTAEKRRVNHANAPQCVEHRFGTDLAPPIAGGLQAILRQIAEMDSTVLLTLDPLPDRRSAFQRPNL